MTDTTVDVNVSMNLHIGDTGKEIALMCLAEKGAYYEVRRLLAGAGGFVPDEPERIRRAIGADRDEWTQVWPHIEPLFPVADGKRYHQATLDDLRFRQARREAGRKGGQQPHPTQRPSKSRAEVEQPTEQEPSKCRATDRAKVDPPSPSPSPSPDPTPEPTPTPGSRESDIPAPRAARRSAKRAPVALSPAFEAFWEAYPADRRNCAKAKAMKLWPGDEAAEKVMAHVQAMIASGFTYGLGRYLRERVWETLLYHQAPATNSAAGRDARHGHAQPSSFDDTRVGQEIPL